MKTINYKENEFCINENTVVTIGNFDGLHKGHLKLIKKVLALKKKTGCKSVVLTFDMNTKLNNNLIFEKKGLESCLRDFDIDYLVRLEFAKCVRDMSCCEFAEKYLIKALRAKYVVVGENFFFGKNKSGDANTLTEMGRKYGFEAVIASSCTKNKETVSSTLIRSLLSDGKIKEANSLMYRPFCVSGTVKKGFHIGTSILNIPTANISLPKEMVMLKNGVYATDVAVGDKIYKGVTNIGTAPTNPKKEPLIETFILDFNENIYRKRIKIIFIKYMRGEKRFSGFDSLKKQITHDIEYRKGL